MTSGDGDLHDIERQPHDQVTFEREHNQNREEQGHEGKRADAWDEARPIPLLTLEADKDEGA